MCRYSRTDLLYFSQSLDLEYFEEAVDYMLSLEQVDKKHGVALMGLSKGGEIVLSMAAFLPSEKLSGVIAMNSAMNYWMQDVVYKGNKVLTGKEKSLHSAVFNLINLYIIGCIFFACVGDQKARVFYFRASTNG